jgi:hypothetical protein
MTPRSTASEGAARRETVADGAQAPTTETEARVRSTSVQAPWSASAPIMGAFGVVLLVTAGISTWAIVDASANEFTLALLGVLDALASVSAMLLAVFVLTREDHARDDRSSSRLDALSGSIAALARSASPTNQPSVVPRKHAMDLLAVCAWVVIGVLFVICGRRRRKQAG